MVLKNYKNLVKNDYVKISEMEKILEDLSTNIVYEVEDIYKFIKLESKFSHEPTILESFSHEDSQDGQFIRDFLRDDRKYANDIELYDYVINYIDEEETTKVFFNIIQRLMDEDANYSSRRVNEKSLIPEGIGYFVDDEISLY